jgi:hypothetical protein
MRNLTCRPSGAVGRGHLSTYKGSGFRVGRQLAKTPVPLHQPVNQMEQAKDGLAHWQGETTNHRSGSTAAFPERHSHRMHTGISVGHHGTLAQLRRTI